MSAFHHHPNHHNTTTSYCYCQSQPPPPCHPPLLSPPTTTTTTTTTDPFLIASIVAQLLHSPNPQNLYSHHINPTSISQNQRHPHQQSQQFHPHSPFFSLLQRIDALESSLQRFSSSSSSSSSSRSFSSLRDAAARTIQAHFRAYLVSRSRTLRQLKQLASIKSGLASIKSSLNIHGFVDFDSVSHNAMDLLLKLDSIQSGDKMIKDSKRSVTKEIVEFLELVDGACVKRQQVLLSRKMRSMRLVRNDNRAVYESRGFSERNAGPKYRNVDSEEKKLIANLKERVEKIGRMSKLLDEQEVFGDGKLKSFKHVDEEDVDDTVGQVTSNYRLRNGLNMKKNGQSSNAKKRVCFVEDENLFRVYNNDGNCRSASRVVDVIENSSKETDEEEEEEEEAQTDGEGSSQSSEDLRKRRSDEVSARSKCRNVDNEEKKLIANLKERVEKIGKMSKALEEQEVFGDDEVKGFKHVDDEDDDTTGQINSNFRLRNGLNIKKNGQSSNAKKRVCFVEDGNVIRAYDNDGNSRSALRVVDVIEDSIKGTHDEEEPQSDGEGSSSEDVRKCRRDEVSEEYDNNQDEEFTFSTTAPVKMEPKADFLQKKPGVKIVG